MSGIYMSTFLTLHRMDLIIQQILWQFKREIYSDSVSMSSFKTSRAQHKRYNKPKQEALPTDTNLMCK